MLVFFYGLLALERVVTFYKKTEVGKMCSKEDYKNSAKGNKKDDDDDDDKKKHIFWGVVGGLVLAKVLKTDTMHKVSVATVSQGLKIKASVDETIEEAKAATGDIVAEAKANNEKEELVKRIKELEKERDEARAAKEEEAE